MATTPLRWSQRYTVFTVGWIAYATTYLLRRPLSVIKADIEVGLQLTKTCVGWLDIALNLPYAAGQIYLSSLGDVYPAGPLFALCLFSAAASCVTFGCWDSYYIYFALLFWNGLSQSLCWPCVCKVVGSWFPSDSKQKNIAFGVLGVSASAGSVLGTSLATFIQDGHGWRYVFVLPSIITVFVGSLVLLFFHTNSQFGSVPPPSNEPGKAKSSGKSFKSMWKIRLVPDICVSLFCVKTVRYIVQMWIPMYLLQHLGYSYLAAGMISTAFDVGGMVGSSLIGSIIKRCYQGDTLRGIGYILIYGTASLVLCHITSDIGTSFVENEDNAGSISAASATLFLFLAGACNFGSDSILGGSLPYEVGERDGRNSGAAIAGFVNGFGTLGGVLEGPIVGLVSDVFGWTSVFYLMIAVSAVGACTVFRAWSLEEKDNEDKGTNSQALDSELSITNNAQLVI